MEKISISLFDMCTKVWNEKNNFYRKPCAKCIVEVTHSWYLQSWGQVDVFLCGSESGMIMLTFPYYLYLYFYFMTFWRCSFVSSSGYTGNKTITHKSILWSSTRNVLFVTIKPEMILIFEDKRLSVTPLLFFCSVSELLLYKFVYRVVPEYGGNIFLENFNCYSFFLCLRVY